MIRLHGRKENKMEYNSIFELDDVLNDLHIEHMGSYGSQNDLIEAWDGFDDPVGHMDVFACLEYLSERRLLKVSK